MLCTRPALYSMLPSALLLEADLKRKQNNFPATEIIK